MRRCFPRNGKITLWLKDNKVGFFKKIFKRNDSQAATPSTHALPGPRYGLGDYLSAVNKNTAMTVAAVFRCVTLLSESVANLPVQVMRKAGAIYKEDTADQLAYLLNVQPDYTTSAYDFWCRAVANILLDGNAYIVPIRDSSTYEITRLVLCDSTAVAHDTIVDTYTVTDITNGVTGTYQEGDIIHLKGFTFDGKNGVSVLTFARRTLAIANTSERETLNRFSSGGVVRGIVSNPRDPVVGVEYQDEEIKNLATDVDYRFRNDQRIVGITGQASFTQLGMSSADMQFLESRKFTVRDIARFFGVHPSFLFDDTSNNYKSAEMANVAFLSNTLNPLLRKIECELQRKLVPKSLFGKKKFQFDRRGIYACDLESKVDYQAKTIAAGIYTVNDWRLEENKEPVEGGDKPLVSANLKTITELNNQDNDYSKSNKQ